MRPSYEKPTKKTSYQMQNKPHQDPLTVKQQQYQKCQPQKQIYENQQSLQTDIDIDNEPRQLIQKSESVQQDVQIDTDLFVNAQGRFERRQNVPMTEKRSASVDTERSNDSEMSLGFERKRKQPIKPKQVKQQKTKTYHIKPETLQKHIRQLNNKIANSNYPNNVMRRVHPIVFHQDPNKTKKNQPKPQNPNVDRGKTTKITLTRNQQINIQRSSQSNKNESLINELRKLMTPLSDKIPQIAYNQVEMADKQLESIRENMQWIGRIIARRYIEEQFGQQKLIWPEIKKAFKEGQQTERNILQLRCMLRYRSVVEIIYEVRQILDVYGRHNQYLIDLDKHFQEGIPYTLEYFRLKRMSAQQFNQQVFHSFNQTLLYLVAEQPFSSRENKLFLKQLYQRQGYHMEFIRITDGEILQHDREPEHNQHKLQKFYENQGLFKPFKFKPLYKQPKKAKVVPQKADINIQNVLKQSIENNQSREYRQTNQKKQIVTKDSQPTANLENKQSVHQEQKKIPHQNYQQDVQIDGKQGECGKTGEWKSSDKDIEI